MKEKKGNLKRAHTDKDFHLIAELASIIWTEHYPPIIGVEQVNYMLDKFQSFNAIKEQVQDGVFYFIMYFNNKPAGYLSYYKKEDSLFLSKLYVLDQYRGKKIGKTALIFIEDQLVDLGCDSISLTVNKNNSNSIKAYQKMGFKIIDTIVIDIGNGFVMDDYFLKKKFKY